MKKIIEKTSLKRLLSLVLVLVLLFNSALVFTSCVFAPLETPGDEPLPEVIPTKSEIEAEMLATSDLVSYEYAVEYLKKWGIPVVNTDLFKWVERTVTQNYVEELPGAHEMARASCTYFLENKYDSVDFTDADDVTKATISSYLATIGDKYAVFRTSDEYEEFNTDMSGSFVGIGVSVEYNYTDNTLLVTGVFKDSAAQLAGIMAGDYIYAVDGVTLEEAGYDATVNSIRGEIDTQVTVTVLRDGELIDLVATRKLVVEQSVEYSVNNGIGYIIVSSFKANTFSQFKSAIDRMKEEQVDGIIFDLRSNPGGYLSAVMDVLSYLIPMGTPLVSYQYRGSEKRGFSSMDPHFIEIPCVVICNQYTASAGELFTAAMRDYSDMGLLDVTVVGNTTYGKGIMQSTYTYSDKSSLTLTVSYYNPPCGVNYHGTGVVPDVECDRTSPETDEQYDCAVEEIIKLIEAASGTAEQINNN